ncbi:uncharacterized protein LOC108911488 isoform X2 [Anoplophora glabripennis]|uniref:uncharacterized protein LOC108911488 isoform X2 n=1 Tax=Anoplophora glabripennis TaxID=217634 RepID=UPI000873E729|nr:uncharacterized protein LOC108911488 isoform X2 [Anoplophora glabripennis]
MNFFAVLSSVLAVLLCLFVASCIICVCYERVKCGKKRNAHHQDDIYSISGRVQGEEQQHSSQDAYLSIDHINISNQLNKPNYDDAPPSYEEAMRIAVAASLSSSSSEVPTVVVVPKTTN